jgi:regulator of replication initiation timing
MNQEESTSDTPTPSVRGVAALERLRDRVEVAARELARLRSENEALSDRLSEVRPEPDAREKAVMTIDEDPEVIRRKVSGFIEILDSYLERDPDDDAA